jgi:hypothetical protein
VLAGRYNPEICDGHHSGLIVDAANDIATLSSGGGSAVKRG